MAGETFRKNGLFYKPGSGGSDEHNRGYYVDGEALAEAIPVANPGDYARVESTDTFWLWDNDDQEWKDSHKEDMVLSVNNKTGAVVLTATDVGALPDNTHIPADPVQADWNEADSDALDYIKNKPTIPAAQVNSDWNASSGVAEILNKPTLGTAAAASTTDFATAAQGALAATAIQPNDNVSQLTNNANYASVTFRTWGANE